MRKKLIRLLIVGSIAGCAAYEPQQSVRQQDLDAWVGVPTIALETHSFFIPLPFVKTKASDGIEIWHYSNKMGIARCSANIAAAGNSVSYRTYTAYQQCSSELYGCDSIFYIRDGEVQQYKTAGSCYTTEEHQPQPGWQQLQSKR